LQNKTEILHILTGSKKSASKDHRVVEPDHHFVPARRRYGHYLPSSPSSSSMPSLSPSS